MKVINMSERRYEIHTLPQRIEDGVPVGTVCFSVPAALMTEDGLVHGECEIPDEAIAELLAKDKWTKAVFASGHLAKATADPPSSKAAK